MGKLVDLTGKKFGRVTVIGRAGNNKWNRVMWLCKCECGSEWIVSGNSLRRGCTKSCGCLHREQVGERYRLSLGIASMRSLIGNYKKNAKKRGFEYNLTEEQFRKLTQKSCHYCGTLPSNVSNQKRCNGAYSYNGLDRIDNTKGYTIDNVVPCCRMCNIAKNNNTLREFQNWILKIYNRMHRKEGRK